MERDCHNCARTGTPDGVCLLSSKDTKTCLDNPSRPFWQPVLTDIKKLVDKKKLVDFIEKGKESCPIKQAKNGLICDFCFNDNASQLGPCLTCDKTYSEFVPRTTEQKKNSKSLFEEVRQTIHKKTNSNFHYEALPWPTKVWFKTICNVIEEHLQRK